jgi:hypothetical protein
LKAREKYQNLGGFVLVDVEGEKRKYLKEM